MAEVMAVPANTVCIHFHPALTLCISCGADGRLVELRTFNDDEVRVLSSACCLLHHYALFALLHSSQLNDEYHARAPL